VKAETTERVKPQYGQSPRGHRSSAMADNGTGTDRDLKAEHTSLMSWHRDCALESSRPGLNPQAWDPSQVPYL
jgi:hypothetical protein